jgi:N-acetylglucosaminyldiphosphoundecaprenol N-acetyl-beta-D-mannosaminyltransferase
MHKIFGITISTLNRKETAEFIVNHMRSGEKIVREDLNAAKVVWCEAEGPVRRAVESASIVNPDGQSVVWAARLLGVPVKERVTGIDLMQDLIHQASIHGLRIYLLGAHAHTVSVLADSIVGKYSEKLVAGYADGYFVEQDEPSIANKINDASPDMLFIGISSPKKEEFVLRNADALNVGLIMGVGGSFDVLAGKTSRAPLWMQNNGLEWLYRLIQEPGRMWKRYLVTNSQFIVITMREYMRKKFRRK